MLAGVASFLIAIVALQLFTKSSPAFVLYFFHDHVYLLVKGLILYKHSPGATIIAFWFLLVGLVFLLFWLADSSAIRSLHIRALKIAIPRSWSHRFLVEAARRLTQVGFEPVMMRVVIRREWQTQAAKLNPTTSLQPSVGDALYLNRLTGLLHNIHLLPGSSPSVESYLQTYEYVQKAYFMLLFHGKSEDAYAVMKRIRPRESWLTYLSDNESPFNFQFVLRDICMIGLACDDRLLNDWFPREPPAVTDEPLDLLVASLYDRCAAMERWIAALEEKTPNPGSPPDRDEQPLESQANSPEVEELPLLGRMAAGISLHTACLAEATELGLRFMDGMEVARFLAALVRPGADPGRAKLAIHIGSLLASTPGSFERAIAAHMLSFAHERRASEWSQASFANAGEQLISDEDVQLSASRVAALLLAAGPDYWTDDHE